MQVFVRICSSELPVTEITFFRMILTLTLILPYAIQRKVNIWGTHKKLLFVRAVIGFISFLCVVYAIAHLKFGDWSILWKTSVIFTAALSAIVLRERITLSFTVNVLLGLIGLVIVVKPTYDLLNLGGLAALAAAITNSIVSVSIKRLHESEDSLTIISHFCFWASLLCALIFGHQFVVPSNQMLLPLLAIGITGTIGQILYTSAFKYAPASLVQTFSFSEVLFALILGFFFWSEIPAWSSLIGGAFIVFAGLRLIREKSTP